MTKKFLFENIKSGDLLSFHFKSWHYIAGVFIGKVTGKTGNDLKIPGLGHIGIVVDVERRENYLIFKFCEYLVNPGKSIKKLSILRDKDYTYLLSDGLVRKNVDLYYTPIKKELTDSESAIILNFWQDNKAYSIIEAATSPNWAERILKFFGYKKNTNENNFCSGGVYDCLKKAGRKFTTIKNGDAPTPVELVNDPLFEKTVKINENN